MIPHSIARGSRHRYMLGCRCAGCTLANALYLADYYTRRVAELSVLYDIAADVERADSGVAPQA